MLHLFRGYENGLDDRLGGCLKGKLDEAVVVGDAFDVLQEAGRGKWGIEGAIEGGLHPYLAVGRCVFVGRAHELIDRRDDVGGSLRGVDGEKGDGVVDGGGGEGVCAERCCGIGEVEQGDHFFCGEDDVLRDRLLF